MACKCGGHSDEFSEAQSLELTNFSDEERKALAKKGAARPDGSYPIRNATDIHHAVNDVNRTGDAGAKAWVIKRAKQLNLTDQLPATWELSVRIDSLERAVLALAAENLNEG
jgi:hypothetical protein